MMRTAASAVLMASLALPAWAGDWVVLPAKGERPPPRDPTLMRLTDAIATALEAVVGSKVGIAERALAEDACANEDGECPRDVAVFVNAKHAVSLVLRADQSAVDVRVYGPKVGLEKTVVLPCKWAEGLAACATEGLGVLGVAKTADGASAAPAPGTVAEGGGARKAEKPAKGRRASGEKGARAADKTAEKTAEIAAPPPAEAALDRAFAALATALQRCRAKGWGDPPPAPKPEAMAVRFRLAADGAARDVRLDPAGFTDVPALSCMARQVESLRVPAEVADEAVHTRALPLP